MFNNDDTPKDFEDTILASKGKIIRLNPSNIEYNFAQAFEVLKTIQPPDALPDTKIFLSQKKLPENKKHMVDRFQIDESVGKDVTLFLKVDKAEDFECKSQIRFSIRGNYSKILTLLISIS